MMVFAKPKVDPRRKPPASGWKACLVPATWGTLKDTSLELMENGFSSPENYWKLTYPLKNAGWKTIFLLKRSLFRWRVHFWRGIIKNVKNFVECVRFYGPKLGLGLLKQTNSLDQNRRNSLIWEDVKGTHTFKDLLRSFHPFKTSPHRPP